MSFTLKKVSGGATAPKGFKAAGVACGIKQSNKKDLALVFSKKQAHVAAVFTTNKIAAAPVLLSKKHASDARAQAVVINSGNANACTGEQGKRDALEMAKQVADILKLDVEDVIVASTGIIGVSLPMDKITVGIKQAAESLGSDGSEQAAEAIMTTDTELKQVAIQFELAGKTVILGGMAKGSGMICPDMAPHSAGQATMLAVVTTDAKVCKICLQASLISAVDKSFNMITVDGETSTNDMVVLLANGQANNEKITLNHSQADIFQQALDYVCTELAKMIVEDGEGMTKFLAITVKGAESSPDAKLVAKAIANSNLVKTAFFGEDANWGRIVAAIGHSGAEISPRTIDIYFGDEQIVKDSQAIKFNKDKVEKILQSFDIEVAVDLNAGKARATVWTTDLSYDYVKINAEYRT